MAVSLRTSGDSAALIGADGARRTWRGAALLLADRSSGAAGTGVPQLARRFRLARGLAGGGRRVVAGRLDVGVRRLAEPARVHQHPPGPGLLPMPPAVEPALPTLAGRSRPSALEPPGADRRPGHHRSRRVALRGAGDGRLGDLARCGHRLGDRGEAPGLPGGVEVGQHPAPGGAQRHPARTRAPYLASDHQQPGVEQRRGVRPLRVLEERRVDRPARVVEGARTRRGARIGSAGSGSRP